MRNVQRTDCLDLKEAPTPASAVNRYGWPSHELLEACGATFRRAETPRVVEVAGVQYIEGYLELEIRQLADEKFEASGQGRPNETKRRSLQ